MDASTHTGSMLWFNEEKGHGFIATDDGERLFVAGDGFLEAPPVGPCAGKPVAFEIMLKGGENQQLAVAWQQTLAKIGIDLVIRSVDASQFVQRQNKYDFDAMMFNYTASLSPGVEQVGRWGSTTRDQNGTLNFAGVADPAIDALIDKLLNARERGEFVETVRAYDRVLMSGAYVVPLYYRSDQWVAHWKRIERPQITPITGVALPAWWHAGD